MTWIDWLIVLTLNGAVIGYGLYLARGVQSSSEWFLGGRALPWWAVGLSMFATNVDNADIVSVTGKTFNEGLHILTVYSLGSAVGGILAAFFVTPAIYRAGYYTNAEYLEGRFGVSARVLSALIQIQYRSSMLGMMTWSVYLMLTSMEIVGPQAAWTLIVALVICSGLYTAWGGLKSVVFTDACQSLVMLAGGAVIFAAVWSAAGGWSGMLEALQQQVAKDGRSLEDWVHIGRHNVGPDSPYPFGSGALVTAVGWSIIASGYWTVNHTQTMRLMGSRSLWDMKMAALFGVAVSLPIMIACGLLGVVGRALPEFQNLASPDELYPRMVRDYLGVGMKGLVVAGIVAACISTFDSMGSALSAVFTRDIYARLLAPGRDDKHYVLVGRIATVAVLMLGFLYIPFIILQRNMLDAFTTLIPVFVTPLFAMYMAGVLTRAHRRSGLVGLAVGSCYGLFALYCREAPKIDALPDLAAPGWLVDRWAALIWSLLITSVTIAFTSLLWGPQSAEESDAGIAAEPDGWLAKSRQQLGELREHPFRGKKPPWWASPPLYAVLLLAGMGYLVFGFFW